MKFKYIVFMGLVTLLGVYASACKPAQALDMPANSGQVLDATIYPPITLTSKGNQSLLLYVTPQNFDGSKWTYKIDWHRTRNAQGSVFATLKADKSQVVYSKDPADQNGSDTFAILPSTAYRVEFYGAPSAGGTLLLRKFFTTLPAPSSGCSGSGCPGSTSTVISITNPSSGDIWPINTPQTIRWLTPTSTDVVSISLNTYIDCLYNNNGPRCMIAQPAPFTIASSTPNTGSFTWNVDRAIAPKIPCGVAGTDISCPQYIRDPDSVLPGRYFISITDPSGHNQTGNSGAFNIVPQAVTQPLTITSPKDGEQWPMGSTQTISWQPQGNATTVDITLAQPAYLGAPCTQMGCPGGFLPLASIATGAINNGSFTWSVGTTTKGSVVAGDYRIIITPVGGVGTYSGTFKITPATVNGVRVGQLVFSEGTIYYIDASGKYGIPSLDVFYSWGWNFKQVVTINSQEAALPVAGVVPMRDFSCNDPIAQINHKCGSELPSVVTSNSLTIAKGVYSSIIFKASSDVPSSGDLTQIYQLTATGTVPGMVFELTPCNRTQASASSTVICPMYILLNSIALDGTPTQNGSYPVTITLADSTGHQNSSSFTVVVADATTSDYTTVTIHDLAANPSTYVSKHIKTSGIITSIGNYFDGIFAISDGTTNFPVRAWLPLEISQSFGGTATPSGDAVMNFYINKSVDLLGVVQTAPVTSVNPKGYELIVSSVTLK